ncbi:DNA adenine methylase [Leptothermofonsia sichuanensis]
MIRGSWPDKFPTEADQTQERQRLFNILGRIETETDKKGNQKQVVRGLVSWDDVNDPNSGVLEAAQREIARCLAWERGEEPPTKPDAVRAYIAKYAPPVYDPFAGGGSIPLEAQRLGLEAHASDLNPVAMLINKALIEIPPRFKDQAPVNPEVRSEYGGVRSEGRNLRSEYGGVRSEGRQGDALPGVDYLAEGDGGGSGALSSSTKASQGGNLRDAIANYTGDRLDSSQHSRGVDQGIRERESTISGDRSRVVSGDGNITDAMREPGMVSDGSDANAQRTARRGESNADHHAAENEKRVNRSEERVTQFSLLTPHSSNFHPHSSNPIRRQIRPGQSPRRHGRSEGGTLHRLRNARAAGVCAPRRPRRTHGCPNDGHCG